MRGSEIASWERNTSCGWRITGAKADVCQERESVSDFILFVIVIEKQLIVHHARRELLSLVLGNVLEIKTVSFCKGLSVAFVFWDKHPPACWQFRTCEEYTLGILGRIAVVWNSLSVTEVYIFGQSFKSLLSLSLLIFTITPLCLVGLVMKIKRNDVNKTCSRLCGKNCLKEEQGKVIEARRWQSPPRWPQGL